MTWFFVVIGCTAALAIALGFIQSLMERAAKRAVDENRRYIERQYLGRKDD
jgi:3-polyprenyl-4-hydroxybenzoate decarboxylase